MDHYRPKDKDATLGLDQGYQPLHVRQFAANGVPGLQSLWKPTPAQLALLNAGGLVALNCLGTRHPPVLLDVVEAP